MRVEILGYILTVAETKSVSKASKMLNIQQTTLSSSIKVVEDELGYPIFARSHHGVALTKKGEQFLPLAENLIKEYKKMFDLDKIIQNPLNVYVNYYLYNAFLNDIYIPNFPLFSKAGIHIFRLKPESFWSIEQERYGERRIGIDQSEANALAFRILDAKKRYYKVRPLRERSARFYAYINKSNPLARNEALMLKSVRTQPMILGNHSAWELKKIYPDLQNIMILEGQDFYQLMRLVDKNMGIVIYSSRTVLPAQNYTEYFKNISVIPVEIENYTPLVYQECLIYREDFKFSELEQKVVDLIIDSYK